MALTNSDRVERKAERHAKNLALNETTKGLMSGRNLMYLTAGAAAFVGISVFQFLWMIYDPPLDKFTSADGAESKPRTINLPMLDVTTGETMEKVAYGGYPHVLYCVSNSTQAAEVPEVIGALEKRLLKRDKNVVVAAADCFSPTPFGKSLAELYNLGNKPGFLAVFGNQEEPMHLNYLPNAKYISTHIMPKIKTTVKPIVYLKDWEACSSMKQGACFVLGGSNQEKLAAKLTEIQTYSEQYRGVKFVSVDTGFWRVKAEQPLLDTKPPVTEEEDPINGFCVYKKYAGAVNVTANATIFGKFLQSWEDESAVQAFFEACQAKKYYPEGATEGWGILAEYPAVKAKEGKAKVVTRTKKAKTGEEGEEDLDEEEEDDDGTTQGAGERVGRRQEETEEEEDDVEFDGAAEEESEEEMAL